MFRKPVRPRALPEQSEIAMRRVPVDFQSIRDIGNRVQAVIADIGGRQPNRPVPPARHTLAGVQADKIPPADQVKNAPDLGIIVRGDIGWRRPSLGAAF